MKDFTPNVIMHIDFDLIDVDKKGYIKYKTGIRVQHEKLESGYFVCDGCFSKELYNDAICFNACIDKIFDNMKEGLKANIDKAIKGKV